MRAGRDFLFDVMLVLAAGCERRHFDVQALLPLSVRIGNKLCEMLIAASEVQTELASDEAGALREIAPEIDDVVARIDALLKQLAA